MRTRRAPQPSRPSPNSSRGARRLSCPVREPLASTSGIDLPYLADTPALSASCARGAKSCSGAAPRQGRPVREIVARSVGTGQPCPGAPNEDLRYGADDPGGCREYLRGSRDTLAGIRDHTGKQREAWHWRGEQLRMRLTTKLTTASAMPPKSTSAVVMHSSRQTPVRGDVGRHGGKLPDTSDPGMSMASPQAVAAARAPASPSTKKSSSSIWNDLSKKATAPSMRHLAWTTAWA